MTIVRTAVAQARCVFVVGKGGTGKTTVAAALALELADAGAATHVISTDPAHSLYDVLGERRTDSVITSHCSELLRVEEFAAASYADAWLARATGPVTQIVERGTYLDAEDVAGFTRLALPGLDEVMAVLRLVDLIDAPATLVVDTAPTGHTLRLLDAADTHAGVARALRAMAEKAAAVASSFARRAVHLSGESIIEELERYVARFRSDVLQQAAFVVAARADPVVQAETARLLDALAARSLRVAATVYTGAPGRAVGGVRAAVPMLPEPAGCAGLRAWRDAVAAAAEPAPAAPAPVTATTAGGSAALPWLLARPQRLLLFAGKGGVGKSTCAAAVALALADTRDVLLCSADPAGSLTDILPPDAGGPARLRVMQVDAAAQLARLRESYRADVMDALERIGLSDAAALDRRVIDALWDLAPPGIDEFAALAALLDAAAQDETIVLDTAPTGHFLRLLTMPQIALDWVRQLMRIFVKYRAAGAAGGAGEALLQSSRELRALQQMLHDSTHTGIFIITLDEPVVAAETARLEQALRAAAAPIAAVVHNRATRTRTPDAATSGRNPDTGVPTATPTNISAPLQRAPPAGAAALRDFLGTWNIVG